LCVQLCKIKYIILVTVYDISKLDMDKWVKGVDVMQDCESCSDPCVTGVQMASTTVTSVGSGRRRNLSKNYSKLDNFFRFLSVLRIRGSVFSSVRTADPPGFPSLG
jgi:hypothetical protein